LTLQHTLNGVHHQGDLQEWKRAGTPSGSYFHDEEQSETGMVVHIHWETKSMWAPPRAHNRPFL